MAIVDRLIREIHEPFLILVGAKIHSLLVVIVDEGERTPDNLTQLQRFSDMVNLDVSATEMVHRYRRQQLGL